MIVHYSPGAQRTAIGADKGFDTGDQPVRSADRLTFFAVHSRNGRN